MPLCDPSLIRDLERSVCHALETRDESGISVIGYGEVSTVLKIEDGSQAFACKRLPPFPSIEAALSYGAVMRRYIEALSATGINCIESTPIVADTTAGNTIVYCVQPLIPGETVGPDYFRTLTEAEAIEKFAVILDHISGSVSSELAPDGQLSNWAFHQGKVLYLDVTTPFMRDSTGKELLNWRPFMVGLPRPLRLPFYHFVLPGILEAYHSVRGQVIDFLGNLRKERLEHLIDPIAEYANTAMEFERPIVRSEAESAYKADARTYATLQAVARMNRWLHAAILRKTYPLLLPPKIERNI